MITFNTISCQKEAIPSDESTSDLTIKVAGIQEDIFSADLIASNDGKVNTPSFVEDNIQQFQEFDVATTYQSNVSNKGIYKIASTEKTPQGVIAALPTTRQYRLVIYDNNLENVVKNIVLRSGTTPRFSLPIGATYRWYAFTILHDNKVPNIDNTGKISRTDLSQDDAKDFALDYGTITPTEEGPNVINITFVRQNTRYKVSLDSRGIFGNIDRNKVKVQLGSNSNGNFTDNVIQFGDFDIKRATPQYVNLAPTQLDYAMTEISESFKDSYISGHIYSAPVNIPTGKKFVVKVKNLEISHFDNNSSRTYASEILLPINIQGNLTEAKNGIIHKITSSFVEKAIQINGVKWARTNLYYDETATNGQKYRFRFDNNYTADNLTATQRQNEFWLPGSPHPFDITKQDFTAPCNLVYPLNYWTDPDQTHYDKLIAATSMTDNTTAETLVFNPLGYINGAGQHMDKAQTQYWMFSFSYANNEREQNRFYSLNGTTKSIQLGELNERRPIRCIRKAQ